VLLSSYISMRLQMFAIKTVDLNKVLTNFLFKKGDALRPAVVPRGLLFRRYYLKAVTHLNLRNACNHMCRQGLILQHRSTVILYTSYISFTHVVCEIWTPNDWLSFCVRYTHYQPLSDAVNNTTLDLLIKTSRFLQWQPYGTMLSSSDFHTSRDYILNYREVQYHSNEQRVPFKSRSTVDGDQRESKSLQLLPAEALVSSVGGSLPRHHDELTNQHSIWLERHRRWDLHVWRLRFIHDRHHQWRQRTHKRRLSEAKIRQWRAEVCGRRLMWGRSIFLVLVCYSIVYTFVNVL